MALLMELDLPGIPRHSGKVREVFDFGSQILFVATDRISAFDWILPNGIPDKGTLLTQVSCFWFEHLGGRHHLVSTDPTTLPLPEGTDASQLSGRSLVVEKTRVLPIECVVRGYLAGSGWKDYQSTGQVSGVSLPEGMRESERFPEPIFTPSTKATEGHDMPIDFDAVVETVGAGVAEAIRKASLDLYRKGAAHAESCGLILADTKFEFGLPLDSDSPDDIVLIDEVLTPDSSRYWPADEYEPGRTQNSFDKQYVRNWLLQTDWDRNSPPPELPEEIITNTRLKYVEAYERLTGKVFEA